MANTKVKIPEKVQRGEVFEIRAMAIHPMESGFRLDNVGGKIARHIIDTFTCRYAGKEIFKVKFHPAVAANPYLAFFAVATQTGDLEFTWVDDRGGTMRETAHVDVT
jgi:sulfur-oxidizing protein SoxZ